MATIELSHTAKYNRKYNMRSAQIERLIRKALPYLYKEFDLPYDFKFLIRPIKGNATGRAISENGKLWVEIDCRAPIYYKLIETIAHECTHIEQYKQNRIVAYPRGSQMYYEWVRPDGSTEQHRQSGVSYETYFAFPWEVEARARGKAFAEAYGDMLLKGL